MLNLEFGKADNIKDTTNRNSVKNALKSCVAKLKSFNNKTPKNGLAMFCGDVMKDDNKTVTRLCLCFEPFKALNISLYSCDHKFHVD